MLDCKTLFSATLELKYRFAGSENDNIKVVILSWNKRDDELHIWYFESPGLVTPLGKDEFILACYYAPDGNWDKYYGNEFSWLLTNRRISLDILNNTVFYDEDFPINSNDVLPSWLLYEIKSYF